MSKQLRFASLIRVSTEKQKQQGESLRTQQTQIDVAVESVGGKIVKQYGGQEHATAGWEHAQVDLLIRAAASTPRPFDAVIVTHPDRWSRDNVKSETGLAHLRDAGVRFFELGREHDLFDPNARMYLSLSTTIGAYQSAVQKKKSIENRIARARRGIPTAGRLPYGRTFDRQTGKWGLDRAKVKIITDIARRYLAGEGLEALCTEYNINHSSTHKTLMKRAGSLWSQTFCAPDLRIDETVEIPVPALLDDKTIRALRKQAAAGKTYHHGHVKNRYLLSRMAFCESCGYAMFGQENKQGTRYYRHHHRREGRPCPRPIVYVPADQLEAAVIQQLFEAFGNPKAMERAIHKAIPDLDKINQLREQIGRIEGELKTIDEGRARLIARIDNGTVTEEEADRQLIRSAARREKLQEKMSQVRETLATIPAPDSIKEHGKAVSASVNALIRAHGHVDLDEMSYEDKRALVESVFGGQSIEGQRLGVYLSPLEGQNEKARSKRFRFTLHGHLIEYEGITKYAQP